MSLVKDSSADSKGSIKNDWDWDNNDDNGDDDDDAADDDWDNWADAEEDVLADDQQNSETALNNNNEKQYELDNKSNDDEQTTNADNNNTDLNKNSETALNNNNEKEYELDNKSNEQTTNADNNNTDLNENSESVLNNNNKKEFEMDNKPNEQTTNADNNNTDLNKNSEKYSNSNNCSTGWGSLFGNVVSTVLSTASEGIENITASVTHGLDKVIGVPDPEEMARLNALEESQIKDVENKEEQIVSESNSSSIFGLNIVSGVSSLGSKVINTGLDTLEGIGKKTMNILQENDPNLRDKIKKITLDTDKTNLSEVLKQARAENESLEKHLRELKLQKAKDQFRFETIFEDSCGLAHLEALETLHNDMKLKIQFLKELTAPDKLREFNEILHDIEDIIELENFESEEEEAAEYDENALNEKLLEAIADSDVVITFDDLISLWTSTLQYLSNEADQCQDSSAIFTKGITFLSKACAIEICKLHKVAELMLIKEHHSTSNEIDCVVQLCHIFINHLNTISKRFANKMVECNKSRTDQSPDEDQQHTKTYITTLFAELLKARAQIEKAFYLFLPIFQIGAVSL